VVDRPFEQPLQCSPIASGVLAAMGDTDDKSQPTAWNKPAKTMAEVRDEMIEPHQPRSHLLHAHQPWSPLLLWQGTSIEKPVRLTECIDAVKRSNGGAVRLSEQEIADATLACAKIGMYTEPTCAQAAAAYTKLLARGVIKPEETTVIVLTSTGVKATPMISGMVM
jgi:threonine synthase